MRKLLRYMRRNEWIMAAVCALLILGQIYFDLSLPDYMSSLTVLIKTPGTTMDEILRTGLEMLGCTLASAALCVLCGYLTAKVAAGFSYSIRESVFNKIADFGQQEMMAFSVPSLINRTTNDITQVQTLTSMGLQILIKSPVMAVWAIVKIVNKSWTLSAITAGFVAALLVMMVVIFVLAYIVSGSLTRPLREMAKATEAFARGDFSVRVPVNERDEIGKLAMAFNNMADSLAQQETVRRSFIANVSHELKTPMTSIAGFIDGILDGTIPQEKERHYLTIVSDEVKRLSRMVRSMLNIAKIEAGEMKLKPTVFDVNEVVLSSIFTFEQMIEKKHLDIRGLEEGKVMVEADEGLINQVVYNLLENAVKFVNEGGYIEVSYTVEQKRTYIHIKNSGEGIPKEEISKVFDRFYKTDRSRSMDKTGVGLGLYIVRQIVNLHQGEVIVRSVEGEYCEFSFSVATAPKALTKQPKPVDVREV